MTSPSLRIVYSHSGRLYEPVRYCKMADPRVSDCLPDYNTCSVLPPHAVPNQPISQIRIRVVVKRSWRILGRLPLNTLFCRISDVSASTMWPSRGRVLPRGGPRPSDLQRAPAYPVTPDRPKVSLEVMNIDGMTLCEREARRERAQSRRSARSGRGMRANRRPPITGSSAGKCPRSQRVTGVAHPPGVRLRCLINGPVVVGRRLA